MNTDDRALADLIARLRRLLAKATPLPWTYEDDDEGSSMGWICAPNPTYPELSGESIFDVCGDSAQQANNAEFAVAALAALPTLLDRLEAFHAKPVVDARELTQADYNAAKELCAPGNLVVDIDCIDFAKIARAFGKHRPAALHSPPPVVSGEAGVEWPERAIRVAEALEHEVMTERDGTLWCQLCSTDCGEDGQEHARSCVLFNGDEPVSTPPVVEEGRREAIARELYEALNSSPTCYRWDDSGLDDEHPGSRNRYYKQADAILALTPVEGVGDDDLLKRSASAEQAYANMHPEHAAMIARIIDSYHFDTPFYRARAHEVVRAMAGHPRDTPVAAQGDVREALERIEYLATNHGGWFEQNPFGEYAKPGNIASKAIATLKDSSHEG